MLIIRYLRPLSILITSKEKTEKKTNVVYLLSFLRYQREELKTYVHFLVVPFLKTYLCVLISKINT